MAENKFIRHLKGEGTAKSLLEVKNQNTPTSFADMPDGTSNANDVFSDHRGNATSVLKGTENWKLDGQNLVETTTVYGDGRDFTNSFSVFGNGLWVDATCTFATARRFSPNTKFVLKLCGHDLDSAVDGAIDFTLLIKFGSTVITKSFRSSVQAFNFCKEFVVDFAESNTTIIKLDANDTMQIQLLCGDATAQAVLYNGMTVFTALQRRVDGDAVASDKKTFDEVVDDVEQLQEDLDDLEEYVDETFVKKAGDTMSGALNIANIASSNTPLLTLTHSSTATYKWNIAPRYNSTTLSIYPGNTETNGFRFATTGFVPASNNARYLGSASLKWKGIYVGVINNGADLTVPNKTGTLATMDDVELAARSGRMLTSQGVWYAKMYSATVAPSAEDGTNYADFSQVDNDNNPIIVIYTRTSGAWVQSETITPPADYDGYVPVTSKIWDIAEQAGQQGGRVLWNHTSKEFTPYPIIISFEDIEITGTSTVIMPNNPGANQIVNKDYVDTLVGNSIGDATITLTQGGQTMGSFTTNQSGDATIALDGGSSYHPDLFDWKWADHQVNDVQWLRADTFSWQSGTTYEQAYWELFYDIQISTNWYREGAPGYTAKRYPEVGDTVYLNSDLTTPYATVEAYDSVNDTITAGGNVYNQNGNTYVTPTTETVAGYTVSVYTGHSGRKITIPTYETAVSNIYTATGVAWYYIIDIPNKRFKLPRAKHNKYTETLDVVGNGRNTVYTDGTNDCVFNPYFGSSNNGIFVDKKAANIGVTVGTAMGTATNITEHAAIGLNTDPTKTNVLTTPIPQDTDQYKYLYFYVGNFTQTALENTAGLNAELFNDKADTDLGNVLANIDFVIERQEPNASNNYTWYRKYRSGWVEQGGRDATGTGTKTINLPVTMADEYYTVTTATVSNTATHNATVLDPTTTSFKAIKQNSVCYWVVAGMAAN